MRVVPHMTRAGGNVHRPNGLRWRRVAAGMVGLVAVGSCAAPQTGPRATGEDRDLMLDECTLTERADLCRTATQMIRELDCSDDEAAQLDRVLADSPTGGWSAADEATLAMLVCILEREL